MVLAVYEIWKTIMPGADENDIIDCKISVDGSW